MQKFSPLILVLFLSCTSNAYRLNRQGIELAQQGEYDRAIEMFQAAVDEDPETAVAYLNLVRTYLLVKKPEAALAVAQKAVELSPGELEARLLLVQTHYLLKDYESARGLLDKMAREEPDNPFLYLATGDICLTNGEWDAAIDNYRKALSLSPEEDRAYLQMGRAYLGKELQRLQHRGMPLMADVEDPQKAMSRMGNLMATGGLDLDHAAACFRKAVYLNAENLEARVMLGIVAFQRNEYQQAALEWEEALRLDPKNGFLYMALGLNAKESGEYDKSAHYLKIARQLSPGQREPVVLEILLAVARGNHGEAVRQALAAVPDFPGLEENVFEALSANKITHFPWLVAGVAGHDRPVAEFCARALACLSRREFKLDPDYWQNWWDGEKKKLAKNAWHPPEKPGPDHSR